VIILWDVQIQILGIMATSVSSSPFTTPFASLCLEYAWWHRFPRSHFYILLPLCTELAERKRSSLGCFRLNATVGIRTVRCSQSFVFPISHHYHHYRQLQYKLIQISHQRVNTHQLMINSCILVSLHRVRSCHIVSDLLGFMTNRSPPPSSPKVSKGIHRSHDSHRKSLRISPFSNLNESLEESIL
jgi:hypothetical protein